MMWIAVSLILVVLMLIWVTLLGICGEWNGGSHESLL